MPKKSSSKRNAGGPRNILEALRKSPHEKIKVAVADIDGVLRGKYLIKEKFLSAAEKGFGFCDVVLGWDCADVCYDNAQFTGWHTGYPDAHARIDLATYRTIPWENDQPFFLGEFVDGDGEPLGICPRQLLKKIIKRGVDMGFTAVIGVEFEWFNFRETPQSLAEKHYVNPQPLTPGMFGYSLLRSGHNQPYFGALMDQLKAFGVPIEGLHTETGPGVFEAAILCGETLEATDRAVLFKTGAKEIAYRHNVMASFMAKWNAKLPGCSGHIHQSIWDKGRKKNLFHDEKHAHRMSPLYHHYLAGQLRCLPEILPFFAPTVNSYKRLVEGLWAPTRVTWGIDNRTTAFRVIPGSKNSTRLETRVPGSDINPYLAVAAALAAGLYGIENEIELHEKPVTGSAYEAKGAKRLPKTLQEATEVLAQSKIAREILGEEFVEHFVQTRRWEWHQFQDAVTNWETERYFEII